MNKIIEDLSIKMNLIKARKKLYCLLYIIYLSINVGSLFIFGGLPNAVILTFFLATWGFSKLYKYENNNMKAIKKEIKEQLDLISNIEKKEGDEEMVESVKKKDVIENDNDKRLVINLAMIGSIINASITNNPDYITNCQKQLEETEEKGYQKIKK